MFKVFRVKAPEQTVPIDWMTKSSTNAIDKEGNRKFAQLLGLITFYK